MKTPLFPIITEMAHAEMIELALALNNPSLQKYLYSQANASIRDISYAKRKEGETAESFLERVAEVRGGLGVLSGLLAIEPPVSAASPISS